MEQWYKDKQKVSEAVAGSISYQQVLRKLGLKNGGMTIDKLKDSIKEFSLDISHFQPKYRITNPSVWYNQKLITSAVECSTCWADVVRYLGQAITGTSYSAAKRAVERFNLSTLHFNTTEARQRNKNHQYDRIPTPELFVTNSTQTQSCIRSRILREALIPYQCKCGNIGEWQGHPLTLQLDHKNGCRSDNRVENLQFLCPNCHTQTLTWGARNRKL